MGDRCFSSVIARVEDQQKFKDIGYRLEYDRNNLVEMVDEAANYANTDELEELAEQNIPFIGYHDSGGGYSAGKFVSFGGEVIWICYGEPNFTSGTIKQLIRYRYREAQVDALFNGNNPAEVTMERVEMKLFTDLLNSIAEFTGEKSIHQKLQLLEKLKDAVLLTNEQPN